MVPTLPWRPAMTNGARAPCGRWPTAARILEERETFEIHLDRHPGAEDEFRSLSAQYRKRPPTTDDAEDPTPPPAAGTPAEAGTAEAGAEGGGAPETGAPETGAPERDDARSRRPLDVTWITGRPFGHRGGSRPSAPMRAWSRSTVTAAPGASESSRMCSTMLA